MFLIVKGYLVPKGYDGLAVYPFIIVRRDAIAKNLAFINHERIHLRQQAELLVIPFYLWYILEYLLKLIKYKNKSEAYRNISFEREAYQNEKDLNYLKSRPLWKFRDYLR